MPKRTDIQTILLIGSGPIVIGQACEFDYSGTQACKALQGRGLPGRPGQLEPGDDHDRSGVRRPHLRRAAHRRDRRARSSSANARTRCCRPSAGRPALNLAHRARRAGRARALRRRADRRQASTPSRRRRIASCSRPRCSASASTVPRSGIAHTMDEARRAAARDRPAADHPPVAHARRHRRQHRRDRRGVRALSGAAASPPRRSARCWSRSRSPAGRSSSSR